MWQKKDRQDHKSHAKGRSFSWLMYLILISCSLTCVTLSKYTKIITGTATATIALPVVTLQDGSGTGGAVRTRQAGNGGSETVIIDRLSDGGYYVFTVKNFNEDGIITEVPMQYSIQIRGVGDMELPDFQLFKTDIDGNIASTPIDGSDKVMMSIEEKQSDTYVIYFEASLQGEVQVTVMAEQL